jgi:hypothetical protein
MKNKIKDEIFDKNFSIAFRIIFTAIRRSGMSIDRLTMFLTEIAVIFEYLLKQRCVNGYIVKLFTSFYKLLKVDDFVYRKNFKTKLATSLNSPN